jgi:hypothetical protein
MILRELVAAVNRLIEEGASLDLEVRLEHPDSGWLCPFGSIAIENSVLPKGTFVALRETCLSSN